MTKPAGQTKDSGTPAPVRVAVVGAGRMANNVHYPSIASFDDVDLVGICDINPTALNATADKYGVSGRYAEYRRMVDELNPDGVYAIGQPEHLWGVWVWCLERGLNLYIEKPMGLNLHQAEILAHLADTHGCVTQVSHQRRACPLLVKMQQACLERGPITHTVCEFYKYAIRTELTSYDRMLGDCTHSIDTLRWMCGGEVVSVESHCRRIQVPDINWIGATVTFDNGSIGYIINSWASGRRVFRVQMHAPGIYTDVEVEGKARLYVEGDYEGVEYDTREVAGSDENYVFGGFRAKHREFIDSIRSGREQTGSSFRDCVKTMEVAHRILAQAVLKGS